MFSTQDTIVAVATPPGRGGLGVVRISGPECRAIAGSILDTHPLQVRHATFTRVRGVDEVVATLFAGPRSYTGEDVVEISAHGSPVVLGAIVRAAQEAGARLAEPGEFTLRAFLHGRIDLVQAEAVADLIDAVTPLQARAAFDQLEGTLTRRIGAVEAELFDLMARLEASLDFPEEGYHFIETSRVCESIREIGASVDELRRDAARGRMIREGARVVIVGRTNTGKSSLFNMLAGSDRAIVTDQPGTTRDLVTEVVDVHGLAITLVDTAGFRESADVAEREGVDRARRAVAVSDLLLVTVDRSTPLGSEDEEVLAATQGRRRQIVATKADQPEAWRRLPGGADDDVRLVSSLTGIGLDGLKRTIADVLMENESDREPPSISNLRHIALLDQASAELKHAEQGGDQGAPEEFLLADLQRARWALEEITGQRSSEDLLRHIFERFCIGK